jgi:methionyl-tRNA formyltransferase
MGNNAEAEMKIIFLTTNDPLYLPALFDRVLARYGSQTQAVYIAPPLFRGQTPLKATWRYYRTFGAVDAAGLTRRVVQAKVQGQSVAAVCKKWNVPQAWVEKVNAPEFLAQLRQMAPDIIMSVSCPQVFKKPLIELPRLGCLNIHGAILPNYRGIMPSFWMMANGEKQAGVSVHYVNEKIDAGDLCGQCIFDILPDETLDEFLRRSKAVAADLLIKVFEQFETGAVTTRPLNLAEGSYYSWPDPVAVSRFRAAGRRLW